MDAVEGRRGRPARAPAADGALWVAVVAWVATVALVVIALALLVGNGSAPSFGRISGDYGQRTVAAVAGASCTLAFATVGTIIVWHRRRELVGWLFCAVGLALAVQAFTAFYATRALVARPGSLSGGELMGWVGTWVSAPAILLIPLFCFLLFPDGRLPSAGWRPVAWLDGLVLAAATVGLAFRPGPLAVVPSVDNPLAVSGVAAGLMSGLVAASILLLPPAVVASVGALIVRLRRARGIQRQQLKWFASAAALVAAIAVPVLPGQFIAPAGWAAAALVALIIGIACLPVSAGIAIMRYRLYDLDALLNRTLVYGTLTTVLAAGYAGIVLAVGAVLGSGGEVSSLAVAVATLAVAAMFQPARRRVQRLVDRRFNRRRYNAGRTLEGFAARLRQQTDLDALVTELLAVVDRTMEPTQVSLWLRPTAGGGR